MKINEIYKPSNFIDILLLHIEKYPSVLKYMESCVKSNMFLHHNTNATTSEFIVVTEDHKSPQDGSHNYFGNYFDDYFIKSFGKNFRKDSIYTTLNGSSYYGSPFIVIPIGDYSLAYSEKVFDLYITWQKLITDTVIYEVDNDGLDIEKITDVVFRVLQNNENTIEYINQQLSEAFEQIDIEHSVSVKLADQILNVITGSLKELLSSYDASNEVSEIPATIERSNNEVMIVADKFLLLNKKKILSKTGKPINELFSGVINRYNKGERF